ncbi:hypothetical protein TRFO_21324 [Tritrichomonas foetus]|uniref:Exportin-7/Ran-binding protein 17 TPR repeats domain-containing protein n=1 Tax=Tritrichomonas foetus TaxID=1144522 RepID=A0A1J4KK32_9EUKA|nr:hypothetical protein TRFO_21324 [Tritrichomonas foetus]|eukprot:OHT09701.1 hypothetical protein TRFO_21324 [Tritrichomonas foetus]
MNGLEPISILMAVDEVYSNGNSDPHYLEILANFQSNPENIPKCQEILNDIESSDACRFFASNTLCKIAQNFLPNWNISLALQLSQWSINYLLELSSNFDRNVFINLSKLNAIILHYFWDSNHEECMEEWGSIIELFDNSPNQWSVGLFLLDSLHDTFLTSTNPKIIEIFSKKCLSTIFSLSFSVAKKMKNTTLPQYRYILEMSLNLINKCILDRNENMIFFSKSPYCALITYDFNDLLIFFYLIEFFFEIFEIFTIPAALKCILSITETADTFDQPLRTRKNKPFHTTQSYNCNELRNLNETPITVMINQICNCVLHVIQSKIGLNDEFTINTLSLILSNIATRMNFFTIQQIKEFKRFIQVLVYFTIYMLESNNHSFENVFHLIQFWSKLEIALRNDGPNVEPKRILANISPQICFSYISSLLNMVTIPGSDTDNAIINFMEAKICQYIFPIQNFIMMNPNLICQQIFTGLLNKQKELEDNINNLQQETFSEEVFQIGALERQLCVFMQIASCVVLIKTSGVQNDPNIKYHPSFFSFMVNLMKCSVDWASKGFLFPRIEMCILLFISQFKNTLFGCASLKTQLSRQLFQQLKNKRSLSSFTECQTFFFDRLIVTLKYFSKFYILLNTTLSILYNDNKILPSSESFANLLDETIRNNLPFMNELKFISLRSKFFSILVKIIFQNHKVDNSYLITILQFFFF